VKGNGPPGRGRVEFLVALPNAGIAPCNLRAEDAVAELAYARHG
jgi:hypothetical protein